MAHKLTSYTYGIKHQYYKATMKLLLILIPFLLYSCEKESDTLGVQSFSYSGCTHTGISGMKDSTQYQILNNRYLKINRTNVVYNCGLDSINVSLSNEGNTVWISEIGYIGLPANCKCGIDLEYTIGPFEPKTYLILINGNPGKSITFSLNPRHR